MESNERIVLVKVYCEKCHHIWVACFSFSFKLLKLECPKCGNLTTRYNLLESYSDEIFNYI